LSATRATTARPSVPAAQCYNRLLMEFRILGALDVRDRGRPIAIRRGKQRALLAILLLRPGESVTSDALVDELWGEDPPRTARASLQNYVGHLRRALGSAVLLSRGGGYLLDIEPEQVDLGRFKHLVAEGRVAKGEERVEKLREALALWRGPPLTDLAFEPFAAYEVVRLEELRTAALEDLIDAELSLGAGAELIGQLAALINEHPFRERPRAQLMLALYRSGRQAEALDAYQETRWTLVNELGIEPGKKLRQLEAAILRGDPTLDALPEARSNLPVQPTPLVGRERELLEVLALLRENRLVTLTGAGGIGKTRLALMAAAKVVRDFRDGVWFVPLAALRKWELVQPTIAYELEIKEPQTLEGYLRDKRLLIVLDNFEQLLEAAASLAAVLRQAAGLKLLVTSRSPLHLSGEQLYPVPPLGGEEARRLFEERARAAKPSFAPNEHVGEICRRLDNLPLALELAASRVNVLSTESLLGRLESRLPLLTAGARDLPERQQTLRATIGWSYDLLTQREKELFARLAAFAGAFALEAAEAVADADVDTLQSLVDKSLLRQTVSGRFLMLETVRAFAIEVLEKNGEATEFGRRHAEYALTLAAELGERRRSPKPEASLEEFELEDENMRAALEWLLGAHPEKALRLAVHLDGYWWMRDRLRECDYWLTLALRHATEADPVLRADALREAGDTALFLGDEERASRLYEESLTIAEGAGAKREIAGVLINRGRAEEALALYREIDWEPGIALTLHRLADEARDRGEFSRARPLYEESVALWRQIGIVWGLKNVLLGLGDCALDQGLPGEAAESYREALGIAVNVGSELSVARCMGGLSGVAAATGRTAVSARLWGVVEAIESAHHVELPKPERARYERLVQPVVDEAQSAVESGRSLGLSAAVDYALESTRMNNH
jgi:predicted ATPase/DNA-binding SARP family transcriptional activator